MPEYAAWGSVTPALGVPHVHGDGEPSLVPVVQPFASGSPSSKSVQYSVFVPQPLEGIRLLRSYYEGEGPSRAKMRRVLEALVYDRTLITDEMVEERYLASAGEDLVRLHAGGPPFEQESLLPDLHRVAAPACSRTRSSPALAR